MKQNNSLPSSLSQNSELPIRIVSPDFGRLPQEDGDVGEQRLSYYFLVFVLEGVGCHRIDMCDYTLAEGDLLFALPHQIREMSAASHASNYYKLGFDENCISRLPVQYPFLLNPLNNQKVRMPAATAVRVGRIFEMLTALLGDPATSPELILAHLHSLLTEINAAYFEGEQQQRDEKMGVFLGFKVFVETNLTDHPTVREIAEELGISQDGLYQVVKRFSGSSPKEFIINRLMLEARRRMQYGQQLSVKELAYDLGFNDPDYFSRLFKKVTGKTAAAYFQDLS